MKVGTVKEIKKEEKLHKLRIKENLSKISYLIKIMVTNLNQKKAKMTIKKNDKKQMKITNLKS